MSLFSHLDFPSAEGFTPLFRLLDDYDVHRSSPHSHSRPTPTTRSTKIRTFAPRFDVREVQDAYLLDGELPGVNQGDIEIEFSDPRTLVVRGRVKREYSSYSARNEEGKEAGPSHQATVEDGEEDKSSKQISSSKSTTPAQKYWVSERSIGEFQRTFNFTERVDQDSVRASLKDGILSVVVPKAGAPVLKKIRVY